MAKRQKNIQRRGEAGLKIKRADELEKAWKSVDMSGFSKTQAAFVVFVSGKWQKVVPYLKSAGF